MVLINVTMFIVITHSINNPTPSFTGSLLACFHVVFIRYLSLDVKPVVASASSVLPYPNK